MPLLRKQPFSKMKPPPGLRPDDEVFHCTMTNEIFKTYEEFFERTILCNSLVWSCAITGRSGLTYAEAVESERMAEKRLATFDLALQKPLLFLVTLTQKTRFLDLCDDIFQFANDRYFIGESVDVIIGRQSIPAVILRVVAPPRTLPSKNNGEVIVIDEDSEPDEEERELPAAGDFMYVVSLSSNPNKRVMVKALQISRKKGSYNRDRNKLFLKHKCHTINGIWCVKEAVRQKVHLSEVKYEDFFAGPRPNFVVSEKRRKSWVKQSESASSSFSTSPRAPTTPSSRSSPATASQSHNSGSGPAGPRMTGKTSVSPALKQTLKHQEGSGKSSPQDMMLAAQKSTLKQQERLEKLANQLAMKKKFEEERQQERLEKLAKQLAMKKKFEEERQRLKEEKERMREEKEKERQKKLEEKKKKMEQLREWSRPREDMECDDLKPLPEFKEVKTGIPTHLFGDALMVLEYVNAFKTVFDFEQFFPQGFSWDHMESAVMTSDQQGPLCDLVQMLLCALFTLQEAEAGEVQAEGMEEMLEECEKKAATSHTGDDENGEEDDQISNNELIRSAILTAQFSQLTFGVPLKETTLDQHTLTEILRLHLMSSGADANQKNARFRYQQRGGYSSLDDPGLELRKQESALMKKLQTGNVFDLLPDEKLRLLTTLVQQVMTYAAVRDIVEDSYDKLRVKKYDLKILQWSEARRVREAMGAAYRRDVEEKVRDQEYRLKEMARAAQIKQAVDHGLEPPTFPPLEDPRLTPEQKQQREEEERREEEKKKEEFVQKDLEIQKGIMELQQVNAIYPLGRDRLYRRYWYFSSVPAVLVEDHELFVPSAPAVEDVPKVEQVKGADACKEEEKCANGDGVREESPSTPADSSDGSQSVSNGDQLDTSRNEQLEQKNGSLNDIKQTVQQPVSGDETDTKQAVQEMVNGNVTEEKHTEKSVDQTNGDVSDSKQTEALQVQTNRDKSSGDVDQEQAKDASNDSKVQLQEQAVDSVTATTDAEQKQPKWYVVDSKACLQQLLASLNPRGFRENALQTALQDYQRLLDMTIDSCPVDTLCASDSSEENETVKGSAPSGTPTSRKVMGSTQGDSASEVMELTLRDGLLDVEGRIYAGGLGAMKVKDRAAWRAALESGGYSPSTDEAPFARTNTPKKAKQGTKTAGSMHIPEEVVARDLAHALVQIARGMEPRYLKPPFDNQRRAVYERWEESTLGSTSLSQVFLHLAVLDKSIKWNRSTLKLRCRICRRMRDDDKMLLCDKCDRGHHIYCLTPPLTKIPAGDWFCHTCRPKTSKPAPRKRKRNFDAEEDEEESMDFDNSAEDGSGDEDEEAEMDGVEEDDDSDDVPNEDVCAKCHEDGVLILCDVCPRSFHLHCAQPPLKKVPKGKWMCHVCGGQAGKAMIGKKGGKGKQDSAKKGSPYTPNSSSRSDKSKLSGNSRQQTPQNSPTPNSGRRSQGKATGRQHNGDKSTPKGWKGKTKRKSRSADADDAESDSSTSEELMQAAETLLEQLMGHKEAWPFLEPVDKKVAPDYYKVIENPMDLSTIRSKLHRQLYSSPGQLLDDVQLIFANCVQYNLSSAPVYQAGQVLSKFFQSRVRALGLQSHEKSSPSLSSSAKKQRR